jgi:hypothetical protein
MDTFKEFPSSSLALLDTLLAIEPADRGSAAEALKSDVSAFFVSSSCTLSIPMQCLLRIWSLWICIGRCETKVLFGMLGSFSIQSHCHVTHQAYPIILPARSLITSSRMMRDAGMFTSTSDCMQWPGSHVFDCSLSNCMHQMGYCWT